MKRILIIEDDIGLIEALRQTLETDSDISVLTASDGKTGLEIALKEHPDMILLDNQLPALNGSELSKRLRQDAWGKNAQVIVLTNDPSIVTLNSSLTYGVSSYFIKAETSLDQLYDHIRAKLDLRKIPANSNPSEERISSVSAANIPTGMPPSENKASASLLDNSEVSEVLRKSSKLIQHDTD